MKSILIVAAEPSSTLYAERLLELWISQGKKVKAYGIGSKKMESLGFECLGRSEELCVMGLFEVLRSLPKIAVVFRRIIKKLKDEKPQVALLLDYPSFNMKLAKKIKAMGTPVVYYIPPKMWVRKNDGFKKMKGLADKVLCIFSFEKELYLKNKINSEFVGNPLIDELDESLFLEEEVQKRRQRYGFSKVDHVVGLMPGSRDHELRYNLPIQIAVGRALYKEHGLKVCLMVAPNLEKEDLKKYLVNLDYPIIFLKENPFRMLQTVDSVLCASGTATLVVGLMKKPMVVMYRFGWLTNTIVSLSIKLGLFRISLCSLPNIILKKMVVPEFLLSKANSLDITKEMKKIIFDESLRKKQIDELGILNKSLGEGQVTERVAKELEVYL